VTTAKGQYRKRRATTLSNIPKNIQEWFSGARHFTFYAYTYPYTKHLKDYWQAWQAEHPDAVKPVGLDNLIGNHLKLYRAGKNTRIGLNIEAARHSLERRQPETI